MPQTACIRVRSESSVTYVTVGDASNGRRIFGSAPAGFIQYNTKCSCDTDEYDESWLEV
jgi:hypothetical protein